MKAPATWKVQPGYSRQVVEADGTPVAVCASDEVARVIAAAPRLLEFARWVETYAQDSDGLVFEKLLKHARAAVAEAGDP